MSDANEIYLETVPDNFVRCLRSAQNAKSVKIKLTKKHIPCLTFEVELVSNKLIRLMIIAKSVIIVCFAEEKSDTVPHRECDMTAKDQFYIQLDCKKNDLMVVLGDFSACHRHKQTRLILST